MKFGSEWKKKRKNLLTVLLLLSLLAGILGCSAKNEDGVGQENTDVEKTFIVGFDAEFPPYGYKDDNGDYVGFDLDLAEEVCKRNHWRLVKQPIKWASKDMELSSGTIDCLWNGFTMNGREQQYTWSSAYVDNSQVVVVKANSSVKKLEDLAGKVVIVQSDSSALAAFTGENAESRNKELASRFASLQQVADYNSAFMNLEAGAADAICLDIGVANYEVKSRGQKFVILDERVSSENYGIGFKKGNTKLRDEVEDALKKMYDDGTFAKIAQKWGLEDSVCFGQPGADAVMKAETDDAVKKDVWKELSDIVAQLSKGMLATLAIFLLTLLFALPLGLLITFVRRSRFQVLQWIAKIYISVMRGTPLMLQLLIVFFGPYYLFGMSLSLQYRFYAVIIGFSMNYAAYFAEIYRSGIEAVPVGQYEAATVLGYSRVQRFAKIIFPQMVKIVLPPVTNEVITLVKDTSLAFAIAYTEMFTLASQISAAKTSILPLFVAGLFYYVFNFIVAFVCERIEKKMQFGGKG